MRKATFLAADKRVGLTVPQIGTAAAKISGKRETISYVPIAPIDNPMI